MKILIIHNHYLERGGEDEVVDAEIKLLKDRGHEVILYEKTNEDIEKLSFFGKFIFIFFKLNFSRSVYKELKEIVKTYRPDIAHIHNIFFYITPSVYTALKEMNIPVVQSLHNYRLFCLRGTFYNYSKVCEKCKGKQLFRGVMGRCWRNSFFSSFFLAMLLYRKKFFLKNIDSYIVTSKFSRDKFIELGLDREKLYLKTNFLTIQPERSNRDENYALFLGRLVDYKGIETLMKAFEVTPDFRLKIIGDGPLRDEVRSCASAHNNIECLGRVERDMVIKTIKNSSFLIFPSECYENMPLVILESFVFSKPVLASNLGAIKEFVINGDNGLLFNPGDVEDLSLKVRYMFAHNQERVEMGRKANISYQEKFDREKNYRDLIDIYTKTIEVSRLSALTFTYSLADQNFNQTKSLGVFNVSRQLIENIAERGYFTRLNLLSNSSLCEHLRLPAEVKIQYHDRASNKLGRIYWDQWGVYAAGRDSGNRWLFLPKGFTSYLKPRGFKLAVYIHDTMHDFYRTNFLGAMPWYETIYFIQSLKRAIKYSDVIFTNTNFTKSELKRVADNFKIKLPPIITAGIGFDRSRGVTIVKQNSILLLTSAWPHKLTRQAVDFIKRWQIETGFSGNVKLVGSLPAGLRLPQFVNWQHHRRLSEAIYRQFLSEAKVLLFFSKYEGFGMPPVEAMIAGTCPVFSDLPVTREVMEGRGFAFSNDSYESFVQAMSKALNVSEAQIRLWADQLLECHNWNKVVKKITDGLVQISG